MPKPGQPDRPEMTPVSSSQMRITWSIPPVEPEIVASTLKLRIVGSQRFQNYDHSTHRLVTKGGSTVPAPTNEAIVDSCEEGLEYEAIIAVMNSEGWSDVSAASAPACIGEKKPRAKPQKPEAPKLTGLGGGKFKVIWELPEACPPCEASQVQFTDVSTGLTLLVDAANGKLVTSGRTTFAVSRREVTVQGAQDGVEYSAAVCCRNAEGFGDFSMASEGAANAEADTSGMQIVLAHGPTADVPTMEPAGEEGKMKIRWVLPDGGKSTMVKLRRMGDQNWYLCGGTAQAAPAEEVLAEGLEDGLEYECMVSFLVNGRWCLESSASRPACIGEKKQPGIPGAPKEPNLIVEKGSSTMRVVWKTFTAVPALSGYSIKMRPVGARVWQYVNPKDGQLHPREGDTIAAPAKGVDVKELTPGVRYEAAVAFRNKLGQGPFSGTSDFACIGRPTPRLVTCQYCLKDFDMQHAEYSRDLDNFMCPYCRFRRMDPFNEVIEPNGMLLCDILKRGTMLFSMDFPDLKAWRKDDQAVWMRMIKINSDNCSSVWPKKLIFEANGAEVFKIDPPEEGHVRRDVPQNISAGLRPGMNTIKITIEDDYVCGYAMSLVRASAHDVQRITESTPRIDEETSKNRVMTLLADTWATPLDNDDEEEITCVISNKMKLRCPLSFERVAIPVRGESCVHLQCFGLQAYLDLNLRMRAMNNRWTCPVCGNILRPKDLRTDGYVEKVLADTPDYIDEVLIMQDGSYRCIEEAPSEKVLEEQRKKEREQKEKAVAQAEADGEVTVTGMCQNIADEDDRKRKAPQAMLQKPLTKRQRQRREKQRLLTVPEGSDNDSDEILP